MSMNVNALNGNSKSGKNVQERPDTVKVKSGETLTKIAGRFGLTPDQFKDWTGLTKTQLQAGQVIQLPTAEVPKGKGIYALAREYGMSMDEFTKLNKITKDYSAKLGEKFYVVDHNNNKTSASASSAKSSAPKATTTTSEAKEVGAKQPKTVEAKTPEQIASGMKDIIHAFFKSIESDDFKELMNSTNKSNIADVMKAYDDLGTGETLVNAITSEVGASKDYRKDLVMDLYNKAAKAGHFDAKKQAEFKAELEEQFDSWGMVDTENLDKMMNEALGKEKVTAEKASKSTPTQTVQQHKPVTKKDSRRVYPTRNHGKFTVSDLHRDAITSAKREALGYYKAFCEANNIPFREKDLILTPLERIPMPIIDKNGKIIPYESEVLQPTVPANGKIVIINPGHYSYSSRSGYFDSGSYSFIKKKNGKYAPLLEGEKMQSYAEVTAEKLRDKGYAVVIAGYHVHTLSDQDSLKKLISNLQNGKKGNKRYNQKDISFISLHADSGTPEQKNTAVCYDKSHSNDIHFANVLNDNLNSKEYDTWVKSSLSQRNWSEKGKGLQVLFQSQNIPSALVEVEYVNGAKSKNLDSQAFQNRFVDKIVNGLEDYYGFNKD